MNLYLRLLAVLVGSGLKKRVSVLEDFVSRHIVWPNDLDLFGHMNNGRYFTVTDLARVELLMRAGVWQALRQRGLYPVLAGETIQFRRELQPFQRYQIITRTAGWDDKFLYVEHSFERAGVVHALALVKVRVIGEGRPTPADILGYVEDSVEQTNMNEIIQKWNLSSLEHWEARPELAA